MNTPDSLPPEELHARNVRSLIDTLFGIANESTLSRAEVLGALESVKLSLFLSWTRNAEDDE